VTAAPRSRAARVWITIAAVIVAVAALLVVADVVVRNLAQERVAEEIRSNLPEGVEGDVDVTIGGFSVVAQYLSGTMDRVELSAPELTVNDVPLGVHVVAEGVPVDLASPVAHLTAVIDADQDAVDRLITVPGVDGGFTLGDGLVGYDDTIDVFGIPIGYSVTARPTAAGDTVLLQPEGVEVTSGGGAVDVSGLVGRLLGDDPLPICVAEYLPDGVEVNDITIAPGTATVELEARDITLDEASLTSTGSCD